MTHLDTPARWERWPRWAHWPALGAIAGPALFALAWLVLGFLSPGYELFGTRSAPYSAISMPISGLGLGRTGPYMNAAFVLGGLLLALGVVGILRIVRNAGDARGPRARRIVGALLLLAPAGMVVDGLFTLEAPMPHLLGFVLAVGTPAISLPLTGWLLRGVRRWRRLGAWLIAAGPLTLALLVLFLATFDPMAAGAGHGVAGLIQRVLVVQVHAWLAVAALITSRTARPGRAHLDAVQSRIAATNSSGASDST